MNLRDLIVTRKKNRISFLPNFFKYLSSFSFSTLLSPPVVHSTHCLHFSFFLFLQHLLSRPTFMKIVFLLFLTCFLKQFFLNLGLKRQTSSKYHALKIHQNMIGAGLLVPVKTKIFPHLMLLATNI